MEGLVEPQKYDIKDSNVELLGSDLERRVREHGGDAETAWEHTSKEPGVKVWRIEKFHIVPWPDDRKGTFFDGDSYIVLHTYKKTPDSETLSYDLHFWLGEKTTQDEAGTAAYKAVELDDHLHGLPVEYREIQGYESRRFLSYYPNLVILRGGVSTGFHHVSDPPPLEVKRLYRISASTHRCGPGARTGTSTNATVKTHISIREIPAEVQSLNEGDVFVLDLGNKVVQFQPKGTRGKERFLAAVFVHRLTDKRPGQCEPTVIDEDLSGPDRFLHMLDPEATSLPPRERRTSSDSSSKPVPKLFRISDASGTLTFSPVSDDEGPPSLSSLSSSDAFLVDASHFPSPPFSRAVYVWIGKDASLAERRLSLQYAQKYLHQFKNKDQNQNQNQDEGNVGNYEVNSAAVSIVRIKEGLESDEFLEVFESTPKNGNHLGETKKEESGGSSQLLI